MNNHQKVHIFYKGLDIPSRKMVDSQGLIPMMPPTQAIKSIQIMADHSQNWYNEATTWQGNSNNPNDIALITKRIDNLGCDMQKLEENIHAIQVVHLTKEHMRLRMIDAATKNLQGKSKKLTHEILTSSMADKAKTIMGSEMKVKKEPVPFDESTMQSSQFPRYLKEQEDEAQAFRTLKSLKKLKINRSLICTVKRMPEYLMYVKEVFSSKKPIMEKDAVRLNDRCTSVLQNQPHPKENDPGSFTLPYLIGNSKIKSTLADLGASINVMPFSIKTHEEELELLLASETQSSFTKMKEKSCIVNIISEPFIQQENPLLGTIQSPKSSIEMVAPQCYYSAALTDFGGVTPNSILNLKQHKVTSQCSAPLSSAVEQPVAHEPTQFNVSRDSHLEGVPSYSQLCTRNVFACCSSSSSAFQRYSNLCAMDTTVLCGPTSPNAEVSNRVTNVERVFEGSPDTTVLLNENLSCCWDNVTRMPRSVGREFTFDFEQSAVRCDNVTRMLRFMGKDIILDFEQSVVRIAPSEWDSRRVRSKPRHYRDDHYGCLLQQSVSVETQGQSSGADGEPFGVARTGFLLTTGDNIDFRPAGLFQYILDKTHFRFYTIRFSNFMPFKRTRYNVSQGMLSFEESPLKMNRLSTPRARNTRLQKFTSAIGQCRSFGHVGGVSYEYTDLGDCDQQCHHCGAAFWFGERLKGQVYHWIGSLCPPMGEPPRFLQLYIYDTYHELENRMRHFGGLDNSNLDPEIIRLYNGNGVRGYELPASNTLGAIVFDSGLTGSTEFDVIIKHRGGTPKRINKLHRSYMSLQFPLLFIRGQSGFHTELKLRRADGTEKERQITMLAYYAYQLHPRVSEYTLIFRGGRLFQQYVVGVFCCIGQNRLDFIRKKQNDIRSDYLSGLYDAILRGERDGYEVGGRIILLMSFTGGPRYMYAHYLDALAICRKLGNPQFFITFTCNVKWPEIRRYMVDYPELTAADRPDIVCRVFEQKIHSFLNFLKTEKIFETITAVEFHKRGLPHYHTLLWVDSTSKIQEPEDVDWVISAELPDPHIDPRGYKVVSEMMINGPCSAVNMSATCMQGDKRDTGVSTIKHQINLDNSYVVPYNHDLLLAFDAHINVEYCRWSMLIKYLFKYISKGTDRVFARVSRPLEPTVQILFVHLEDMQWITFRDRDRLESVINLPGRKNTTLTEWFAYNAANEDGRHLTYLDFPSEFVWYDDHKSWWSRRNSKASIGHLAYTVHDIFYPTCNAACEALGLLGDENEWDIAMQEACASATSSQLSFVFAHILTHYEVIDPVKHWTKYWKEMSHDIPDRDYSQHYGKSLQHFELGPPPSGLLDMLANRLLIEERNYNQEELQQQRDESVPGLNGSQKKIYDIIINANVANQQELIFVYGHGGTDQTAHSRFKLPIELTEESLCKVTKNSHLEKLLADTHFIMWDEAPMNDRRCFKALDKTLRDILTMPYRLFGGKSVLLGGDFRQTLLVKKGASKIDIIASCISQSNLWLHFRVFTLTENMRLSRPDGSADERILITSFASWLLDIGDGKTGEADQQDRENTSWIDIPLAYCLPDNEQRLLNLNDFIYDQNTLKTPSVITLQHKAIACPKN
ncbi:DNA helicase [Tanacetum coccineum]